MKAKAGAKRPRSPFAEGMTDFVMELVTEAVATPSGVVRLLRFLLRESFRTKRGRGRPVKVDRGRLLEQVEVLRHLHRERDGRKPSDRAALHEYFTERLMHDRGITRKQAEAILASPGREGLGLRRRIVTLTKYVQAERRARRGR